MHFYVDGINKTVNNIDKIISLLTPLTEGYDVTIVGSSAGGYLAMLLGSALKAKCVFSFGGQTVLPKWSGGNGKHKFSDFAFLYKHRDEPLYSKWFDISGLIKSSECKIYHFYSKYCKSDVLQKSFIADYDNVFLFALPSEKHGKSIWGFVYPYLFTMDNRVIQKYSVSNEGNIKSQFLFAVKFAGLYNTVRYLIKKTIKKIKG